MNEEDVFFRDYCSVTEWRNLRLKLLKKYDNTCQRCLKKKISRLLVIHHIIPIFISRNNLESNVTLLCCKCHTKEHREQDKILKNIQMLEQQSIIEENKPQGDITGVAISKNGHDDVPKT